MPGVAPIRPLVRAYIGLGANLGAARAALQSACEQLAALPETRWVGRSAWYRSAPVDASGPDYLNAVAVLDTGLAPLALLHALQAIELEHGRLRPYRNAPRTLDLDLLLHGDAVQPGPELILPHPRLHERAFVLQPLREVAPDLALPGRPSLDLLCAACADQAIERLPS
ncbi:2-amino-4-hydroxy-6-hydroxymethyldihydropteridine diphosphokinase [Sphaerotilus hippei]|uniref:2-amino-4-hydroxy-6-hydroxymethyldihydropteridine pyrophosphokinase n=1 Tax=Sphaerotilus hippei TaxID=744406 RepID=A0A318GWV3_9BURK|nr:2-amino-4-hydroxy-6-hydroxymethyldihydropteridine diphosphokinase [Sphaerotilus hippei]